MWKFITFLKFIICSISGLDTATNFFNIFLNYLLTLLKKLQLYSFADDNAISAVSKSTDDLLTTLKNESEPAVKCFRENNMIVNQDKFQGMVLQTTKLVKLLGITTDSQLRFDERISNLCNKTSMKLNAINCLQGTWAHKKWRPW